jgi:glycosyltransferase involved in cell wall biosynthesis
MTCSSVRVAHLTSVHSVDDIRIFVKECRTLAAAGYHVTMIGPSESSDEIENVQVVGVPVANSRLRRMTRTVWHVLKAAFVSRAMICHFHDPELIPIGILLKLGGRRVIYDVHEDYPRDMFYKYWVPSIFKGLLATCTAVVEMVAGRLFDGVVAATPTIAARFPSAKTITLCNYPLLNEFSSLPMAAYADRPLQVCYVGGLSGTRGVFDMVRAAALVQGGAAQCLQLAGAFETQEEAANSRAEPGWARVGYFGWLDRSGIGRLIGGARAGLVVLHPEPSYLTSYPIKLFEYMSAGIPVIASDFPLWRRIIDGAGCGILVEPRDPQAIAAAIQWVFEHPRDAEEMGRRGREAVMQTYNWEQEAVQLLALYRELVR